MKNKKVILAFSGGLDTSFCVLWLKKQGYQVITATVDTGGFSREKLQKISKQAHKLGVIKHYSIDAKDEFYGTIVSFIIRGNLLRGGLYPLCVGPERIIQAAKVAELALREKADAIAHGSTGAGNDQVRFDAAIRVLASTIEIIVPIRQLGITREAEMKYLISAGFSVAKNSNSYSINQGLLGTTIGGRETKTSGEAPPDNVYPITPLEKTPDKAAEIILGFYKGLPVCLGKKEIFPVKYSKDSTKKGLAILQKLNILGAKHGIGRGIHLGTTILGIKGRIAFAAPGISILMKAHQELEKLVLTQNQLVWKEMLCSKYAGMLHEAMYFDPLARDIETFIESTQNPVTGWVKVKLFKGNIMTMGSDSPHSLMNPEVALYGEENKLWTGEEAAGFSKIYGLEAMLAAKAKHENQTK